MERKPTPHADIAVSAFLIVVCVVALWESRKIPPGTFEPLGSAPVPQAVAGLIILLCLLVLARALSQLKHRIDTGDNEEEFAPRQWDAVVVFGFTVVYVLVLEFRLFQFALATIGFLFLSIALLTRFQLRLLPWVTLVAVVMGYGCQYIFTQIFVVDLPGVY